MEDPVAILDALLASRPREVAEILQATCAAVRDAAPGACEHVFETYVVGSLFTFTGKVGGTFCHPVAYENHVNLGFNRGTELDDPERLLAGTGKRIRHIRIESAAMLRQRAVKSLLRQAVAQGIAMAEMRGGIVPQRVTGPESRAKGKQSQKPGPRKKAKAKKGKASPKRRG